MAPLSTQGSSVRAGAEQPLALQALTGLELRMQTWRGVHAPGHHFSGHDACILSDKREPRMAGTLWAHRGNQSKVLFILCIFVAH